MKGLNIYLRKDGRWEGRITTLKQVIAILTVPVPPISKIFII